MWSIHLPGSGPLNGYLGNGLGRWTGDRVVLGSNPAAATSLRNFDNSVYPALPVSFKGDTKSCRPLLCGVYARGSKRSHQSASGLGSSTIGQVLVIKYKYFAFSPIKYSSTSSTDTPSTSTSVNIGWFICTGNTRAAAQTKMERSMLNITYKDRRTNIWVRERTKLIDIIYTEKNEMVLGRAY